MRFRLHWREVGGDDVVAEDLNLRGDDADELAERVIANFNATLRPGELPREVVRVEPDAGEATLRHDWRKTNLVTILSSRGHGSFDTYRCADCGATGKRFGLAGDVVRDPRFRGPRWAVCPGKLERFTRRVPLPRSSGRMSADDRARVVELSRRCKTGHVPTPDESSYLERMLELHPDDYAEVSEETRRWANSLMNPMAAKEE
jgi:hypothetical protein